MFWIGANTHPSRAQLATLSRAHPDLLDAELMEWDRNAPGGQRSKTRQVSIPDHRRYKYLIDCPGYGYSARVKWLLATGRPLFMVERNAVEHWHEDLKPWTHYVPVAEDLSDLFAHREKLENDPQLYFEIARQAKAFAAAHLSVETRLQEVMHALDEASLPPVHPAVRGFRLPPGESKRVVRAPDLRSIARILRGFLDTGDRFLWLIDDRVFFHGAWSELRRQFGGISADFLATEVRRQSEDPGWTWWKSFKAPAGTVAPSDGVAALLSLIRFNRTSAEAVAEGIENGWNGHPEAVVPSIIHHAGLKIEDIGGGGSFTPQDRIHRWYDRETWHWQQFHQIKQGRFHFPLAIRHEPLAPSRINRRPKQPAPRLLFAVAAGGGSNSHVEDMVRHFLKAGADCWVFNYDDSPFDLPDEVRVIRERGHKWQFAYRHLKPDQIAAYDYLFYWDDDLGLLDFDPPAFVRIMGINRLAMAQPAIVSKFGLSHRITQREPCGSPWLFPESGDLLCVAGRLTNFVEIMAPVFTREAWAEFHGYLSESSRSGWGYDHIPVGRKGIVDRFPVEHLRPVGSINGASEDELQRFARSQGLRPRYCHAVEGVLFDEVSAEMAVSAVDRTR